MHLGEIKVLDKPRAFPLGYFVARSFIGERLALIGDAAHVIHPIAGQGLNMGLKDVAALAEVIVDAAQARHGSRTGRCPGSLSAMAPVRHHDHGRGDEFAEYVLFSNEVGTLLRTVRDIGLGMVDRAPPLKNMFIRQAAGMSSDMPRLLTRRSALERFRAKWPPSFA